MSSAQKKVIYWCAGCLLVILIGIFFFDDAEAGGRDDINLNLTINHDTLSAPGGETTKVYSGMNNDEFDKGMAMSAAGDTCVFDYAPGWQGCVGWGNYGSADALNGSLVTRVDNFAVRVNLQSDTDFDEQAIGVGTSWHF